MYFERKFEEMVNSALESEEGVAPVRVERGDDV